MNEVTVNAPRSWKVRLGVEFHVAGPASADDAASEAARLAYSGELDPLWDADCQVFAVQEDGSETGPFYRSGVYAQTVRSLIEDGA